MKRSLFLLLFISTQLSFAQWSLVKKFDRPLRFIEASGQGLAVVTDSTLYTSSNPSNPNANWLNFGVAGYILGMDSKDRYIYLATAHRIYEHLTTPLPIQTAPTNGTFSSVHCWKGKKLVTINSQPNDYYGYYGFYTFPSSSGSFDTLDYTTIRYLYPLMTVATDDSMAFIGYSNYAGGFFYQSQERKWKHVTKLEGEVVYDSYTQGGITMFRISKAGTDFYFSNDYGQTSTISTNILPFASDHKTVMAYDNGSAFIGYNYFSERGIYQSDNKGQSWQKILLDSAITGLAVYNHVLYAITTNGSLLSTPIHPLVTATETDELGTNSLFFHENVLHNTAHKEVSYQVYDLSGSLLQLGHLLPNSQEELRLRPGVYVVSRQEGSHTVPLKILVK